MMRADQWAGAWIVFAVALQCASPVAAHEGHAPIPSRGATVDSKRGMVALSSEARGLLDVRTVELHTQPHSERLFAFTSIESPWNQKAWLVARLPGRIARILVQTGDSVEAGQCVAELESPELELLWLEMQSKQRELQLAQDVLGLLTPSSQGGAVPEQRILEAENVVRRWRNELWVLRAKAHLLGLDWPNALDPLLRSEPGQRVGNRQAHVFRVLAPISGTVLQQDAVVGQVIAADTHLFQIVNNSMLWAKLDLLEKDLNRVRRDVRGVLSLNAMPGVSIPVTLDRISYGIDPVTQQGEAWCRIDSLPQDHSIRPGMTGQTLLRGLEGSPRLSIPQKAVWSDGIAHYVFVETASTKSVSEYEKRMVWVHRHRTGSAPPGATSLSGATSPSGSMSLAGDSMHQGWTEWMELTAGGLFSGDRVVVQGAHELATLLARQSLFIDDTLAKNLDIAFESPLFKPLDRVLEVDATTELPPSQRTRVAPQLRGVVERLCVDRSEVVEAGQVMAEISSLEAVDLQLECLRSLLDLDLQRETYQRLTRATGALSPRSTLEVQAKIDQQELKLESLHQQLRWVGLDETMLTALQQDRVVHSTYPLRSPQRGVVIDFLGVLGQQVVPGQDLFEVHDLSRLLVKAYIPTRELAQVQLGQEARVRWSAIEDHILDGKVLKISPTVDSFTGLQEAWIEIQNPSGLELRERMLGRAAIVVGETQPTLVIPKESVIREGLQAYVFVRHASGEIERRQIEIAAGDDRYWAVQMGLSPSDSIATTRVVALQAAYASVR